MARLRKYHEPQILAQVWLITFADLLTLLLAFFVMRFSMTTFVAAGSHGGDKTSAQQAQAAQVTQSLQDELVRSMSEVLGEVTLEEGGEQATFATEVRLDPVKSGTRISIGGSNFAPASIELAPDALLALSRIAEVAVREGLAVEVAGHTDDIPIENSRYASNWELSAARATEVVKRLIEYGVVASKISAVGYADTKPLAPNTDEQGRRLNRRVEIWLMGEAPPAPEAQ